VEGEGQGPPLTTCPRLEAVYQWKANAAANNAGFISEVDPQCYLATSCYSNFLKFFFCYFGEADLKKVVRGVGLVLTPPPHNKKVCLVKKPSLFGSSFHASHYKMDNTNPLKDGKAVVVVFGNSRIIS
jgi:hypothetical protein